MRPSGIRLPDATLVGHTTPCSSSSAKRAKVAFHAEIFYARSEMLFQEYWSANFRPLVQNPEGEAAARFEALRARIRAKQEQKRQRLM